ncbi:MAG: DNA primase [Pseudomonadota bacterium]
MNRFPPPFLDEIRSRLRASDVIGRHVQLKKAGREFRGLSPFNKERTPSFYVNDDKAMFFDFSAGKSGDIFKFLMLTQNRTFPEAVEELAGLAGLDIPRATPEESKRLSERDTLLGILTDAARFFSAQLRDEGGYEARQYLLKRGVRAESLQRFGLGYAPAGRDVLKRFFLGRGVSEELMMRAGLIIEPDGGRARYDRFRDRVMFPISDARGRVIAFGGRALSKDVQAKYLNSPETEVFHKGRVLYNISRARERLKDDQPLLICEGYMDALALDAAGYPAVAPLGTALTEDQLALLWRLERAPTLCFDGDRAGRAAAERALDRALPQLSAKQSLRFAFLPEGDDPDDLLKRGGREAMDAVLEARTDPESTMWRLASERHGTASAEQLAAFETELRERSQRIADSALRGHLQAAFKDRFYKLRGELFKANKQQKRPGAQRKGPARLSEALRHRIGQGVTAGRQGTVREAQLVIGLIHHPRLFHQFETDILALSLEDPSLAQLWRRTIDAIVAEPALDSTRLRYQLTGWSEAENTYQRWSADPLVKVVRFTRQDASDEEAAAAWRDAFLINRKLKVLNAEVTEAGADVLSELGHKNWLDSVRHSLAVHSDDEASEGGAG